MAKDIQARQTVRQFCVRCGLAFKSQHGRSEKTGSQHHDLRSGDAPGIGRHLKSAARPSHISVVHDRKMLSASFRHAAWRKVNQRPKVSRSILHGFRRIGHRLLICISMKIWQAKEGTCWESLGRPGRSLDGISCFCAGLRFGQAGRGP